MSWRLRRPRIIGVLIPPDSFSFNVADSFITIGVVILLLHSFRSEPSEEPLGAKG